MMKFTPLWTDEYPRPRELTGDDLPTEVDVAIVGSGYTGLNAAIVLAEAGAQVAVLEQESIGWGASSRNGSMLTPGLKTKLTTIRRWYGPQMERRFWQWSVDAMSHVEEMVREEAIDCDYRRTGMLYLAHKPSHAPHVKAYGEYLQQEFGHETVRWVPPGEMTAEIGSSVFHGGVVDELGAQLQPAKYVSGLAFAAARRGARLVEGARVERLLRSRNGFRLQTSKGELRANEVLLASGGYTGSLAPKVRRGIFPVGSYIITTEPLAEELRAELSPRRRMFYDSKIFLNYFCLTPDGRMMLGGRANLSPDLDLAHSASLLHRRMLEIFPQLEGVPLTHSWSGRLGVSFDQMPHIGRLDGVHYAYGYSGHGITIASFLGKEVGEMLAGLRSDSIFAQIKHPRSFLAPFDRVYLPLVSGYFKMLDRIS